MYFMKHIYVSHIMFNAKVFHETYVSHMMFHANVFVQPQTIEIHTRRKNRCHILNMEEKYAIRVCKDTHHTSVKKVLAQYPCLKTTCNLQITRLNQTPAYWYHSKDSDFFLLIPPSGLATIIILIILLLLCTYLCFNITGLFAWW